MRSFHSRTHPRWQSYDYTQPGAYFVTTVTHRRRPVFGTLARGGVLLTPAGHVAHRCWAAISDHFMGVTIDAFVVMPDHIHAIVVLSPVGNRAASLSQVVGWAKQRASREINLQEQTPFQQLWQRSFHDRIIRDANAFKRIRRYVISNPTHAWIHHYRPTIVPPRA